MRGASWLWIVFVPAPMVTAGCTDGFRLAGNIGSGAIGINIQADHFDDETLLGIEYEGRPQ